MYDYPHIHCEFHGLVKWLFVEHETKEKDIYSCVSMQAVTKTLTLVDFNNHGWIVANLWDLKEVKENSDKITIYKFFHRTIIIERWRKKPLKPIYIGNVLYYVNFSSLIERKIDNFHIVCKCLVNLTSRTGKKATKFFVRLFANYYWCYFSMKLKICIRKYNLCDLWLLTLIAVPKQRSHTHTKSAPFSLFCQLSIYKLILMVYYAHGIWTESIVDALQYWLNDTNSQHIEWNGEESNRTSNK